MSRKHHRFVSPDGNRYMTGYQFAGREWGENEHEFERKIARLTRNRSTTAREVGKE
jgi:hypothetical protein